MKYTALKTPGKKTEVTDLPVVQNFHKVIGSRDIMYMKKELYDFLHLHCGFIAHFDINGFKATYCRPIDFANVFIRHFDSDHRYFNGVYSCHEAPYKTTGFTKADIKREFFRIVDIHKNTISEWVEQKQREEKYAVYLRLREDFETDGISLRCDACENQYELKVKKDGMEYTDFDSVCCVFCGRIIKEHGKEVMADVERTQQRKTG
jgi:hypothetical protein